MHRFDFPKNVNRRLLGIVRDEDGLYWTLFGKGSLATLTKYKESEKSKKTESQSIN